ncbi:MAG: YggS family pyridoxal phosphate-dependent enzyme [Myxococcota bacterium]|nr:YggS family pyridoxal phosphate-dependent enzyme [Myxococcota bacterium]
MSELKERVEAVRAAIRAAAQRCGRDPGEIRLVAVSKTRSADEVREAFDAGVTEFGENYAQELAVKRAALADVPGIRWHMIGHMQRNKIKLLVPGIYVLQTVDSLRLVEALRRRLAQTDAVLDVLVQVDVAGEEQKSGAATSDVPALIRAVRESGRLRLRGLMSIPPWAADAEAARPHLRALRDLARSLDLGPDERDLSMGMSDTYEAAVEEGGTIVRVGTAIFGAR